MTAFADRTVVTIAVRSLLRGHPLKEQPLGSLGPGNQEGTLGQGRVRSLEGWQGPWIARFGVGRICTCYPQTSPLFLQVPSPAPHLFQGPVS